LLRNRAGYRLSSLVTVAGHLVKRDSAPDLVDRVYRSLLESRAGRSTT